MALTTQQPGDVVRFVLPGGGGWGPPEDRSTDAIGAELADAKLSPGHARRHYGIVVDESGNIAETVAAKGRDHPHERAATAVTDRHAGPSAQD